VRFVTALAVLATSGSPDLRTPAVDREWDWLILAAFAVSALLVIFCLIVLGSVIQNRRERPTSGSDNQAIPHESAESADLE